MSKFVNEEKTQLNWETENGKKNNKFHQSASSDININFSDRNIDLINHFILSETSKSLLMESRQKIRDLRIFENIRIINMETDSDGYTYVIKLKDYYPTV